ncbi:uncharacterized protein OCT59_007847 [Rhizophagus irregularis]|uniref:uncharacterized protein n=1 Tax=Rhizophagus irregularis TaxID=588596 RepID=UPI001C172BEA|nr:hypothetical protein OCT59_007847 [Rhizophagus irregularis]CAB4493766.1 unnamed protein product [Rhizophagus irregularis]CAB5207106.1 unnamed protein product [Rhizophagus irregularis]
MLCLNKYCKNLCQDTFQVGFNDVVTASGLRIGVPATQDIEAIITNLTTNGARNYNNVVFTFPNGGSIGAWKQQINANIPWVRNQLGVPNVIITVTRINRDTGIPSSAYDFSEVLFPIFKFRQRLLHIIWLRICRQNRIY